jgi:hypothetical protein
MYRCFKYGALLNLLYVFTQKNGEKPADYVNSFIREFNMNFVNLLVLNRKIRIK